jgi:microsomal epoxide hydrolase
MLDVMRKKYAASSLPYHLIVPSLIGYTLSSGPPTEKNFGTRDVARVMNKLMVMLGFDGGYISQGGDIGSGIARILATGYESCKAVHVNMCPANLSTKLPEGAINAEEQAALERRTPWQEYGTGYAKEHGTRPATIGLVLASSPLALLAWIGEKFLEWSDEDPSLDTILEAVSLYWFTETFPRSIFPYRERWGPKEPSSRNEPSRQQTMATYIEKPFGYSWFPYELFPTPKALAAKTGNLVWHRQHTKGGHFAALERPEDFARDIEDFAATAWPLVGSSGQTLL